MKKNLWYLLALFCCLNFFACGDDDKGKDDDDDDDKDWTDYTGTFGEDNPLLLNGEKIEDGSVKAVFAKGTTDGKAKLTLTGLGLWEQETVVFDDLTVTEKEGNYVFTSTEGLGDTDSKLEVTGTLAPGSRTRDVAPTPVSLTLTTTYSIESDIVGTWSLLVSATNYGSYANFDFSADQVDQQLSTTLSMMVGTLISGKVENVEVTFGADGTFDFFWLPVEGEPKKLANVLVEKLGPVVGGALAQALDFKYYVKDNVVNIGIAMDEASIAQLTALLAQNGFGEALAEYMEFLSLLDSQNGYMSFPVKFSATKDTARFYLDEEKIGIILPILQEMFAQQLGGLAMVEIPNTGVKVYELLSMINNSESIQIGLTFAK